MNSMKPCSLIGQHNIRYVGTLVWTVTVSLSLAFAFVMMHLAWDKYQTLPTITTIETYTYPIWNLRFPAVTICNVNKVYAPRAEKFVKKLKIAGLNEERSRNFLRQLSRLITPADVSDVFADAFAALKRLNYTIEHMMYELMEPCELMIRKCHWLDRNRDCARLFRVVTSSEGFCCAFNYQSQLDPQLV